MSNSQPLGQSGQVPSKIAAELSNTCRTNAFSHNTDTTTTSKSHNTSIHTSTSCEAKEHHISFKGKSVFNMYNVAPSTHGNTNTVKSESETSLHQAICLPTYSSTWVTDAFQRLSNLPALLKGSQVSHRLDTELRSDIEDLKCNDARYHISSDAEAFVKRYMSSNLFDSNKVIPIWDPSHPTNSKAQTWANKMRIGDIGFFNRQGGFETLFNIFDDSEENIKNGYRPPAGFVPFRSGLSMECKVTDGILPIKKCLMEGFIDRNNDKHPDVVLNLPIHRRHGSAVYLPHGYKKTRINQWVELEVKKWLGVQQPAWTFCFEKMKPDFSLVIILETYKTDEWACFVAEKNAFEIICNPILLEKVPPYHGGTTETWCGGEKPLLRVQYGPSGRESDTVKKYFDDISAINGAPIGIEDRKEITESHCIAVRACVIAEGSGVYENGRTDA